MGTLTFKWSTEMTILLLLASHASVLSVLAKRGALFLALRMTFMGMKRSHHSLTTLFVLRQMFQVVHSEKPLYVQAGNCVEASEWLEVLSQVSRCNEGRLATFHPSNYTSGAWQCCQSLSSNAPGCKPCTTWVFPPHQHHSEGRSGGNGLVSSLPSVGRVLQITINA